MDSKSASEVIEILKKVAKDKLVVMVTHNIEQVEQYATRIIKMHDGRIIENTEIKKIAKKPEVEESKYNKITITNKYRLGIRNTFNILSKFLLLFAVFFFLSAALLSEYASFQLSEDEAEKAGYSMIFSDVSENRVLIKKKDKTPFTEEDYSKIKAISNVDYIVEDDLFIDGDITLYREDSLSYVSFYGTALDIETLNSEIDLGRMPESDNEIILKRSKEDYYISNATDEILEQNFNVSIMDDGESVKELKIVGIKYNEDDGDYNAKFYVSKEVMSELRSYINRSYSNLKILLNNKYLENYFIISPSDLVDKGSAVVNDDLAYEFSNNVIKNRPISIEVSNIYYNEVLNLNISSTFTKSNFKRITGYEKYDNYTNAIFINTEEYNSLYNKQSYQSSVYIKEVKNIDETLVELENLGLTPKKVTDYRSDEGKIYKQILKIIKVIVTIILIIVLFFISYLIIKIILKSRNIYYTTLRMLGATYKSVQRILDIELFINSTLAYTTILVIIWLVKNGIINIEYVTKLADYLSATEYIIMYVILAVMTRLISRRFSKKIFKRSAMSTYNEEV